MTEIVSGPVDIMEHGVRVEDAEAALDHVFSDRGVSVERVVSSLLHLRAGLDRMIEVRAGDLPPGSVIAVDGHWIRRPSFWRRVVQALRW